MTVAGGSVLGEMGTSHGELPSLTAATLRASFGEPVHATQIPHTYLIDIFYIL